MMYDDSREDWTSFISGLNASVMAGTGPGIPQFLTNVGSSIALGAAVGGPVGAAVGGVQAAISSGLGLIGRGRKEADLIVPVQNQVGGVLVEVNRLIGRSTDIAELAAAYALVVDTYQKFDAFTRDARFVDGRASKQARNDIRPLVDGKNDAGQVVRSDGGTLGNLERRIIELGGVAPGNVREGGSPGIRTSQATPAGQDNSLLLLGGSAVAAKVFGFF